MLLDVSIIVKSQQGSIPFRFEAEPALLEEISDEERQVRSATVEGSAVCVSDRICVEADITCRYSAVCGRCAKELECKLEQHASEYFFNKAVGADCDEEHYEYAGHCIDLSKMIADSVQSAFPIRELCTPDCKGICPMCGCDLNVKRCSCNTDKIDPRLEILSKLFEGES